MLRKQYQTCAHVSHSDALQDPHVQPGVLMFWIQLMGISKKVSRKHKANIRLQFIKLSGNVSFKNFWQCKNIDKERNILFSLWDPLLVDKAWLKTFLICGYLIFVITHILSLADRLMAVKLHIYQTRGVLLVSSKCWKEMTSACFPQNVELFSNHISLLKNNLENCKKKKPAQNRLFVFYKHIV